MSGINQLGRNQRPESGIIRRIRNQSRGGGFTSPLSALPQFVPYFRQQLLSGRGLGGFGPMIGFRLVAPLGKLVHGLYHEEDAEGDNDELNQRLQKTAVLDGCRPVS